MSLQEHLKTLNSSPPCPAYQFWGDPFFVSEAAKELRDLLEKKSYVWQELGDTPELARLLDDLRSQDLFSKKRVLCLRDAGKLLDKHSQQIADYLETPGKDNVLVLVSEKKHWRKKESDRLFIENFKPLYSNQIPAWLEAWVRRKGGKIQTPAALMLQELAGDDPLKLRAEAEKLMDLAGPGGIITVKEVEALVGRSKVSGMFDLLDAVGARKSAEALKALSQLAGQENFRVVVMLNKLFAQLMACKRLLVEGCREQDVASKLGLHPFVAKKNAAFARNYSQRELLDRQALFMQTDARLKTSLDYLDFALEQLVLQLCERDGSSGSDLSTLRTR